ncbi:L,D-transpeptidase family protein [Microbulbifer aggregans]|uniref:L,D-transpeptidase family protein n=1 Tax=Microbulbifer aggregans TaxID=1769779 RepID=UPI001CFCD779|nr:L,D-transpeptidase family protein [Microbulbifer aggregans]
MQNRVELRCREAARNPSITTADYGGGAGQRVDVGAEAYWLSCIKGLLLLLCLLLALPAAANSGANWFDDAAAASSSGSPSIRINLSEQKAYFYKGSRLVGVSFISSGKRGFSTSPGKFRVLAKRPNHRSSIYGSYVDRSTGRVVKADVDTRRHRRPAGTYYRGAKMNYYIRFNGGVGLHASGHVPRYPASHGCVRMPPHMARKFFQYARVGMPVSVSY